MLKNILKNLASLVRPTARRPDPRVEGARAHLEAGRTKEAAEICAGILREDAGNAEALHCLADVAFRGGDTTELIPRFRAGIAANPREPSLPYKLGCLLEEGNRLDEAAAAYQAAIGRDPAYAKAHNNLGSALQKMGRTAQALDSFRTAARLDTRLWQAHYNIGNAHKLAGELGRAVLPFQEAVRSRRAAGAGDPDPDPTFSMTSRSKLQHDIEQLEYLMSRGILSRNHEAAVATYQEALATLSGAFDRSHMAAIPPQLAARMAPTYNRLVHFYDAPRLPGPAINPELDRSRIEADYARNSPGLISVDDLLTPTALRELRRFCLESSVWFDYRYSDGYLGAYVEEGFICPLLAQIAAELPAALPGIFGNHRVTHLWGYKYDSNLTGISVHGDFAAVNVNFWITPDAANLAPESGGLVVWDKEAPPEWDFDTYNKDAARIYDYLERTGARPITVPHRQNRAVIFNSDLFHKTDSLRFQPGYENRRINITILYGHRAGDPIAAFS